jgi:hypothetical protein
MTKVRITSVRESDPPLYELQPVSGQTDQPLQAGTVLEVVEDCAVSEETG